MKRMQRCLVLAAVTFIGLSGAVWGEESQPPAAEQAKSAPVTLDRRLQILRVNLFEVEGATLELRQQAFRKKLSEAQETVNALLAEDPTGKELEKLQQFRIELLRYGVLVNVATAKEEIESLLSELTKSDEPGLRDMAQLQELLYALDSFTSLSVEAQVALMERVTDYLTAQEPDLELFQLSDRMTRQFKAPKDPHRTAQMFERIAEHLATAQKEELKPGVEKLHAAARRFDLPGSPMELTGKTMEDKQFDVTQLKGKVVLVDFWATWCGPCVAEFPKLQQHYAKYRSRGFEIVGVSLDENHEHLKLYVEKNEIPWIVLHEEREKAEQGWNHPAAKRYGINAIPCMILIGADGNVITTHARGAELDEQLESLFPDMESNES